MGYGGSRKTSLVRFALASSGSKRSGGLRWEFGMSQIANAGAGVLCGRRSVSESRTFSKAGRPEKFVQRRPGRESFGQPGRLAPFLHLQALV